MNDCRCIGNLLLEAKTIVEKKSGKPVVNAEMECVEVSIRTCGTARTYSVISVETDDYEKWPIQAEHDFCPFCGVELKSETEFEKEFLEAKQ